MLENASLPGVAEKAEVLLLRKLLLRKPHRRIDVDPGHPAFALDLRLGLLRIHRNKLGKAIADVDLRGRINGNRRLRRGGNLNFRGGRNNGREAGVVDHPFRQFLVGANADHATVDRRGGMVGDNRLRR